MRYMLMLKGDPPPVEDGAVSQPPEELIGAMLKYNEELAKAGVLLAAEGLYPSSAGAQVIYKDGKRTVVDGPFAEAKELIAGFAILEVDSLAEAVEHARKFALLVGTERVDVRKVMEYEDLQQGSQ